LLGNDIGNEPYAPHPFAAIQMSSGMGPDGLAPSSLQPSYGTGAERTHGGTRSVGSRRTRKPSGQRPDEPAAAAGGPQPASSGRRHAAAQARQQATPLPPPPPLFQEPGAEGAAGAGPQRRHGRRHDAQAGMLMQMFSSSAVMSRHRPEHQVRACAAAPCLQPRLRLLRCSRCACLGGCAAAQPFAAAPPSPWKPHLTRRPPLPRVRAPPRRCCTDPATALGRASTSSPPTRPPATTAAAPRAPHLRSWRASWRCAAGAAGAAALRPGPAALARRPAAARPAYR
jgi:hypothetical protein